MKAVLRNYRQSPRKVRLVAKAIEGKTVPQAMVELSFMPKRASDPIKSLIASAQANAKALNVDTDNLVVSSIRVDKGIVMKRVMPRARGSAYRINKRTSHVVVVLGEKKAKGKSKKKEVAPVSEKKTIAKKKVAKKVTKKTK